jgi:hypothetical protein
MSRVRISALLAATLSLSAPAAAAPRPTGDFDSLRQLSFVSADFVGAANLAPETAALQLAVTAQVEVASHLFFGARLGFGWAKVNSFFGSFDQATYSNVPLSLHYANVAIRDVLSFHVGGGFALPVLAEPSQVDPPVAFAASLTSFTEAYRNLDLFVPRYMPVRAGGGVEWTQKAGPGAIQVRPELCLMTLLPLFDNSAAELFIETPIELEYHLKDPGLGFGARVQPIFVPTDDDSAQVAVEPFVGYLSPRSPFFARAGLLVALDDPFGPATGRDAMTSFRLSLGGKFELR